MSTTPPDWLRDPALAALWAKVRWRLERNGLVAAGSVRLDGLDRASRHAISGLLGRTVTADHVLIHLNELDECCRTRAGMAGLVDAVQVLTGSPMTDRRSAREARSLSRELPFTKAREWCDDRGWTASWLEPWFSDVRQSGLLTRAGGPPRALTDALDVLLRIRTKDLTARTELAAAVAGNAHALDDGTVLCQLVLRGLCLALGVPAAVTSAERRQLWAAAGVRLDAVSTTMLTLNLRPLGNQPVAARLRSAADSGDPLHVSAWDMARCELAGAARGPLLVCENPRVLEAVAESASDVAVVCGFGQPTNLVLDALRSLQAGGAELRYHGDFDWPGVHIANRLLREVEAQPWLMRAADYEAATHVDGPRLSGDPVATLWDPRLVESMQAIGVAVHEEAVLRQILAGVASW